MQLPLRLLIEVIVAMLGGFILWLALVSHKIPDRHASSWLMVGVLLMVRGGGRAIRVARTGGHCVSLAAKLGPPRLGRSRKTKERHHAEGIQRICNEGQCSGFGSRRNHRCRVRKNRGVA